MPASEMEILIARNKYFKCVTRSHSDLDLKFSLIVLVKSIIVGNISTIKMIEMDAKARLHKVEAGFISVDDVGGFFCRKFG